jgi:ubiquinone/menaquinone biosynthesis C-methylase UbiE
MTHEKDPERTEVQYLLDYAGLTGRRVLECGCGDGRLTWRYAALAQRVAGIDVDRDGLRVARIERDPGLEHKVFLSQADSRRLPFGAASFDAAIFAWSF